jgi:predicted AAA+ superfamily ATPase
VKAPKLLVCDTGFMAYLLNASETSMLDDIRLGGRFLETFVGCELLKQADWCEQQPVLMHYRAAAGAKVDYVLELAARRVVGVEVKLSATLKSDDFKGLRSLADDAGQSFTAGVVLYTGDRVVPFGKNLWAVPVAGLWRG